MPLLRKQYSLEKKTAEKNQNDFAACVPWQLEF
jgi:hypothetical protein